MSSRIITSPGVQINEIDLSLISRPIGTTDVFITGFSDQGPTEDIVNIGSVSEYEQVFGVPTNAAERYLYHTAKQILLNSPANLMVTRLPYGSGAGEGYSNTYSALVYPIKNIGVGSDVYGVTTITISNSGTGYTSAPSVEFLGGGPNGTNPTIKATAIAKLGDPNNVNTVGKISAIEITNNGYGYETSPNIQFVGGGGSSAAAGANLGLIGQITNDYSTSNSYELDEPISMLLTDEQYEQLTQNNVVWSKSYNPTINSFSDIGKAGMVIINSAKTTINNLYEGYYIALADNSNFNPSTDYDCVTSVKTTASINGMTQPYSRIPNARLSFSLTQASSAFGGYSISKVIENYPTGYDFALDSFSDSLILTVFKLKTSQYNQDTITLEYNLSEGYSGSLYSKRTQNNQYGGTPNSYFLDTVVNNSSNTIKVITNPYISTTGNWLNDDGTPIKKIKVAGNAKNLYSTGVYKSDTDKKAKDVGNVPLKLQRVIRKLENDDNLNIDVIAEAGLGTIWVGANAKQKDLNYLSQSDISDFDEAYNPDLGDLLTTSGNGIANGEACIAYRSVGDQFVTFADKTRKDHVFIADPLRYIFIKGENYKVEDNKNYIFSNHIYWPLKNQFGSIQSSYVATYGNWVRTNDAVSNKQVWVPSSGYAAAAFAATSQQTFPWIAPAGFTRGVLNGVNDLAINPTQKQRDLLYKININPIAYFSNDGFVIFGQKTLYRKPSAFDRINVRRLFLTLEKETQALLKYFVFEPNTFATRNRLKGALMPTFDKAKLNDGLYDYQLICDERNNTPDVIDNNELKIAIYIKPVRASEFILADFIATRTGVDFSELNG